MSKFSVLIVGFLLIIFTMIHTDEMQDLLDSLHSSCIDQIGVDEELVKKANQGEIVKDNKLKCYMRCILDEVGLFDDNGKLDIDGGIAMLPDEKRDELSPVMRKCGAGVSDDCHSIWEFNKCLQAEKPNLYFLP